MSKEVYKYFTAEQAIDGDVVPVYRAFGFDQVQYVDPFLLLDYFSCDKEIITGDFPWHPHRGIETLTYIKKGRFSYNDSLGNKKTLKSGDVQWTKAGRGIIHQEIPHLDDGRIQGFQLWLNISSQQKMNSPINETYDGSEINSIKSADSEVKVLAGYYEGVKGPFKGTRPDFRLLDVSLKENTAIEIPVNSHNNVVIFLYQGCIEINNRNFCPYSTITFKPGDKVVVYGSDDAEFLVMEAAPINEQIVWKGSIVMNTKFQIQKAYQQLENGTFTK